jgi:Helix-turn-helix domain
MAKFEDWKTMKTGKESKFLMALMRRGSISRAQARSQYRLGNPTATINRIQDMGVGIKRIYKTRRINGVNCTSVTYRYQA